jgi:hypothetical protein
MKNFKTILLHTSWLHESSLQQHCSDNFSMLTSFEPASSNNDEYKGSRLRDLESF